MQKRYPRVVPAAQARCAMKIIDLSYRLVMGKMDQDLFQRIRREILPLLIPIMGNKHVGYSLKVRSLALYLGYIPYLLLSKVYYMVKKEKSIF